MFGQYFCLKVSLFIILALYPAGCATLTTSKANLNEKPNGVRVYPPRIYLFVDAKTSASVVYLPDYARAYDIKPLTFLAKQDFTIEVPDGRLSKLTANQDGTAFLTFFASMTKEAAQVAKGVSKEVITGNFGLASGIYRLNDDGVTFTKVSQ
jgi:hypothetical protein